MSNDKYPRNEIRRLLSLGWEEPIEKNKLSRQGNISFNEDTFDPSGLNSEKDGFWNRHRLYVVSKILKRFKHSVMWEVGAGDGNIAVPLSNIGFEIVCIEPLVNGAENLYKNGLKVFNTTLEELGLPNESISCIGMFDVLGHVHDIETLLMECHRVLKPGGSLVLSLPSHPWLYSNYDVSIKQLRRFSLKEFSDVLKANRFELSWSRYAFSSLVPIVIFTRLIPYKLGKVNDFEKVKDSTARTLRYTRYLKYLLVIFFRLESYLRFPFGLSIFLVATKT